ncbi:MAG: DUF2760 domain-containing protein [Gemmataceae bacterium]|jgi:hypothetical protein|nr:DUF2760 domain-containing protein [Gemmataceae bacterium]
MEYVIGAVIGLVLGGIISWFVATAKAQGALGTGKARELALKVSQKISAEPSFATEVEKLFLPPPPPKVSGEPIRLLAILQQEARLVDFLMENIAAYSDADVGASVRDIHTKAQGVLKKHLTIVPVLDQPEGSKVTVPVGFDPSVIRVVGNVTGNPPFTGNLAHGGWRVKSLNIPKPPEGSDEFVLMPAEVEL